MFLSLLSCSFLFGLVGYLANADTNCSQPPDMFAMKNCCKFPELNLNSFNKKCGKHLVNGAHITPCSFECVFNAAQAINGTSLILAKVEQLLHLALNDNQQIIDIYMNGFRDCSLHEQDMLRTLKRRRMEVVANCSPMPVMYAICAHRYVDNNCPEGSWTNSIQCNAARDYSINCETIRGRRLKSNH